MDTLPDSAPSTTPEIDRARITWRTAAALLASVVVGFVAALAGFAWGRSGGEPPSPWIAVTGMASVVVAVIVHELGHVVAGLAQRFAFKWIAIGPVRVSLTRGGLRIDRTPLGALWGGAALLLPNDDRDLPRRTSWLIAGGPLASLALAGVAWFAAQSANRSAWWLVALASLAIAIVTLVPSNRNGLRSDGGRLLDLLRDGAARRREIRMLTLAMAMSNGRRPAEWDAQTMQDILAEPPGGHHEIAGLLSVYLWCLDREAEDEAEAVLNRARRAAHAHPPILRATVHLECAWWHAMRRGDLAEAERELAIAGATPVLSQSTRHRARAAVLWRQGAHDAARVEVDRALAALATEDMGGATALLERLTRECWTPAARP